MYDPNLIQPLKLAKIYQEERWAEAELERLTRQVRAQKPRKINYLNRIAGWLGKLMVDWGMRLQNDYLQSIQMPGEAKEITG